MMQPQYVADHFSCGQVTEAFTSQTRDATFDWIYFEHLLRYLWAKGTLKYPSFKDGKGRAKRRCHTRNTRQETDMSKSIKLLATLGFIAVVAACAREQEVEEFVVVEPEPISVEPTYTGKYK